LISSKLGIGPMSPASIQASLEYSAENDVQLMLVASRRQVECEELGGGYVDGLTSQGLVDLVRDFGIGDVLVCRDHGGPYQGSNEENLTETEALDRALLSMKKDVDAGFDLIHVDCSYHKGDVYEATSVLIREVAAYAKLQGRNISFEIGAEQNIGTATDLVKFQKDLEFYLRDTTPEFVVGQTGSLVKELFQVGCFDFETSEKMTEICHSAGVKFKEHNVDYAPDIELLQRRWAGVDAINVAPEFGVVESQTVVHLARKVGLHDKARTFTDKAIASGKWKKWAYGDTLDANKAMIAGHYVFNTPEYAELVDVLGKEFDVQGIIRQNVKNAIDRYVKAMA
jgi:hypothetical protein